MPAPLEQPAPVERTSLLDAVGDRLASRPRIPARRLALAAASLALVVLLLWLGLPWATGSTWPRIGGALASLPAWAVPAVAVLGAIAVLLEGAAVHALVPGSRPVPTVAAQSAAGAIGLAVPGGGVVGAGLLGWALHRGGLGIRRALAGMVGASVIDTAVTTVLVPLVGILAYAAAAGGLGSAPATGADAALPGALPAAVVAVVGGAIAIALFAALLGRRVLARLLGVAEDVTGRSRLATEGLAVRDDVVELLRARGGGASALLVLARVAQAAALAVSLRAAGVDVPFLLLIAIFALGRAVSLVPLTPGGAGLTETVIAGALAGLGAPAASAAAVALLTTVAMLVVPVVLGGLAAAILPGGGRGAGGQSSS